MTRNPELEDAIVAAPNDAARYAVYGDWLQAQGDSRGELVSVQAALASTKDTKRFLELRQAEQRLLSAVAASLVPAADSSQVKLSWRFGFVNGLELGVVRDPPALLAQLLAHPALRFVQSVRLSMPDSPPSACVAALITARPPLLKGLELAAGGASNLRDFQQAFPRLEHFTAAGLERDAEADQVEPLDANVVRDWSELRTLELSNLPVTDELRAVLRAAPWRRLRRLGLRLPELVRDDVAAALALPELKHVTLSASIAGALAALAARPNLSALQELELFDMTYDDTVRPLLARRDALKGLKLVIHLGELPELVVKRLRRSVKGLALGDVEVFGQLDAGTIEMDPEEARDWHEREERRARQADYNPDDWN